MPKADPPHFPAPRAIAGQKQRNKQASSIRTDALLGTRRSTRTAPALDSSATTLSSSSPPARDGAAARTTPSPSPAPSVAGLPYRREKTLVAFAGTGLAARNMPERPLTIATYAAGASLAAITLVYVFGPTFFLDHDAANSSRSSRKKGVVGLVNPANDCFINSVLQALAGLPELRAYLIREVHRRKLDGEGLYADLRAALEEEQKKGDSKSKASPEWKTLGLQQGLVTAGLKEVLDALNERPIYKKTISAQGFIRCVETAFRTRISRTQQDAQEFLQVVVERLAEECAAGRRVRRWHASHQQSQGRVEDAVQNGEAGEEVPGLNITSADGGEDLANGQSDRPRDSKIISPDFDPAEPTTEHQASAAAADDEAAKDENIFPLEGRLESQVECSHCHFKPKPSINSFLTLTLNVPHDSTSSTLSACFDQLLKVEHIDDFKCDRCRLEHALQVNARQRTRASSSSEREALDNDRTKIEQALEEDPERPPKDVKLPELSTAPKRRISRFTRISSFPQILAIHLSRSVWDPSASSSKNMAKVSFPETLPLGGLLDRITYRLLGVVTHKGGHDSGHYESFRRQVLNPPFSTPVKMGTEGIYSLRGSPVPSPRVSAVNSPNLTAKTIRTESVAESPTPSEASQLLSTPTSATPSSSSGSSTLQPPSTNSSTAASNRRFQASSCNSPFEATPTPGLPAPPQSQHPTPQPSPATLESSSDSPKPKKQPSFSTLRESIGRGTSSSSKRKASDRWWRISDEKVKESKTGEVLGMQREVYMLFYEIVPVEAR